MTKCDCCWVLQADTTAKLKEAEAREAELRRSLAAAQVILAFLVPSSACAVLWCADPLG
jgi:hypothetical protein